MVGLLTSDPQLDTWAICSYIYMHIYIYTYIYVYIHVYIYIYTPRFLKHPIAVDGQNPA